jgi:hypothetical protein
VTDWANNLADLAAAVTDPATFGEPVTLGEETPPVYGLFDPLGTPPAGFGSEVGLTGRLSAQPNPTLLLRDSDCAGLAPGSAVSVRETDYLITRIDPDGRGLTRLELMPAAASGAIAGAPWQ